MVIAVTGDFENLLIPALVLSGLNIMKGSIP